MCTREIVLHEETAVNPLDFSHELAVTAHDDMLIWKKKKKLENIGLRLVAKTILFSYCRKLKGLEQKSKVVKCCEINDNKNFTVWFLESSS